MDPVTLTLMAASIGGGLMQTFGRKKPKSIDPEWLKRHFGAEQVNEEMVRLFNQIINSPHGQKLLTSAAERGSAFERDLARRAAGAGFGPSGGAESGASIFSQAAAGGATNALQSDVRANVMQSALPIAQQLVQGRMNAAVGSEMQRLAAENAQPSNTQMLGGLLASGANAGLSASRAQAPGTEATLQPGSAEISKNLPVNALNAAVQEPTMMSQRGMNPSSVPLQSPIQVPVFRKRRNYFSRLGGAVSGGMQRLATSAYGGS